MKILVASDLFEEFFLRRNTLTFKEAERFWNLVANISSIELFVLERGFNHVLEYSKSKSVDNAHILAKEIQKKFKIHSPSFNTYQKARLYGSLEFEKSLELESASEIHADAVITSDPKSYHSGSIPIWSVEKLLVVQKQSISRSFDSEQKYYQRHPKPLLPGMEAYEDMFKYVVRTTFETMKKGFHALHKVGQRGLTTKELATTIGYSESTAQNIFLDLENFQLIYIHRATQKRSLKSYFLDSSDEDLFEDLKSKLKHHILLKAVYKQIEFDRGIGITPKKIEEIIRACYCKDQKTAKDYRSRFESWFLNIGLLYQKSHNILVIPNTSLQLSQKTFEVAEQLEIPFLFESIDDSDNTQKKDGVEKIHHQITN